MSNIASPWHLVRPGFILLLALTLMTGLARAEDANSPTTNLEDFVHYALVANVDLAESNARKLMGSVSDTTDTNRLFSHLVENMCSRTVF